MNIIKLLFIFILLFVNTNAKELEKVTLKFHWKYQFEFAGFIAAKEKGFYKDAGLDVHLKEFKFGDDIETDVLNGKTTYAIGSSDTLLHYLKGKELKLLASYFKRSALVILTSKDIEYPEQFIGKTIMSTTRESFNVKFKHMFDAMDLDINSFKHIEYNYKKENHPISEKIKDFTDKKADIMSAFITNEPYKLKQQRVDFNIFNPSDYGIYNLLLELYTSKNEARKYPKRTKDFIEASNRGWEYAFSHKDEIIKIIKEKYNSKLSYEFLNNEAMEIKKLIIPAAYKIGSINKDFLNKQKSLFTNSYNIKEQLLLKDFIFNIDDYSFKSTLSKNEKLWIKNNPLIKIAVMDYWKSDNNGNNIHTDILKLLSKYSDLDFIPTQFSTWSDGFNEAIRGNIVHGISNLSWTKEREKDNFYYSKSYSFTPSYLITNKNSSIKNITDLEGKTVYIKKNSITKSIVTNKLLNINIIYKKGDDIMYDDFYNHKDTDAFITSSIDENKLEKYNLKVTKTLYDKYSKVAIGISHNHKELNSIIKKIYQIIPKNELIELRKKVYKEIKVVKTDLILSEKERKWLEKNIPIKYVYDPDWAPFEWKNEIEQHDGIISDILKLIKKKTNINFVSIPSKTWQDSVNKINTNQSDMYSAVIETKERKKILNYTKNTLYQYSSVLISINKSKIDSLNIKKQDNIRVGIIKGNELKKFVIEKYPNIKVVDIKSVQDGLKKLRNNNIDLFGINNVTAKYLINKKAHNNLKIAINLEHVFKLKIAISKSIPIEAINIIDKALRSISENELSNIYTARLSSQDNKIKTKNKLSFVDIMSFEELFVISIMFFSIAYLLYLQYTKSNILNIKLNIFIKLIIFFELSLAIFLIYEIIILDRAENNITKIYKEKSVILESKNNINELSTVLNEFVNVLSLSSKEENIIMYKALLYDENEKRIYNSYYDDLEKSIINSNILTENDETTIFKYLNDSKNNFKLFVDLQLNIFKNKQNNKIANEIFESKDYISFKFNISDNLNSMNQSVQKIIKDDVNKLEDKIRTQFRYILIIGLFFILGNIYIFVLLRKKVINPIVYLTEAIDKFQHNKSVKKEIFYKDEIGSMTEDFFKMKERINNQIEKIEENKHEITQIHKHTRDSIEYASHIQGALIPNNNTLNSYFKDSFVYWMPKDTVGGDIWLFNELRHKDECLLFFIDCTGHGVPGAFVTMIVKAIEREIVEKIKADRYNDLDISPAYIMKYFNRTMKKLLKQESKDSKSNAGWDGGIIYYNKQTQILKFAGAETPLFYTMPNGELKTIKGNRYSVGYKKCDMNYEYKEHIIDVEDGMKFYCTTDGYIDQNGGEKDFPFGKKRFTNIIKENYTKPMNIQKDIFVEKLHEYENIIENNDRNDDITLIGFEIID